MKKNLTELVFVLDRSGSMCDLTDDTIGGFNSMIREQSAAEGDVLVTTYLFSGRCEMLHDRVPIADVPKMTEKEYSTGGGTALMDCLGEAMHHIVGIHRYAREEDRPEHTMFAIITDGMENASRHYTADEVRKTVKHEQEKYGWGFIFLVSNIDAAETAERYGIDRIRAVDQVADGDGTHVAYNTVNRAMNVVRVNMPLEAPCCAWRDEADADFSNRANRNGRKRNK